MLGRLLKSLTQGFQRQPDAVAAALEEARLCAQRGDLDAADRVLSEVSSKHAGEPSVVAAQGLVAYQRGRYDDAVLLLQSALERSPEDAVLTGNYAEALRAAGYLDVAEPLLRRAVALQPGNVDAWLNLAILLGQRGLREQSSAAAQKALESSPDNARAHMLLGSSYLVSNRPEEALTLLRRAIALDPGLIAAHYYAARAAALVCDWTWPQGDTVKLIEYWAAHPEDTRLEGIDPFFAYQAEVANAVRLRISEHYAAQIRRKAGAAASPAAPVPRPPAARRRIGYLSADFHDHATMHLAAGLFEEHDRARYEVFAYSLGDDDGSEYRRRIVAAVEHFVDVRALPAQDIARRVRDDGIDILVDMKGFTYLGRPEVLALRPAPVQVNFLGYPGTLGRGLADYVITDRVVTPPGSEGFWGEAFALLPGSFQANDRKQKIAARPTRAECGLPEGATVLCSFNSLYKIEPTIFEVWMRVLKALPATVLWLQDGPALAVTNLRREARARGVDPARLVFAPQVPKAQHLARLSNADLFVDTRYVNAHTGASDALWAGVPLVTCAGDSFPARVAASLLCACALSELVAQSLEEYERLVLSLAGDPARLQGMRARLAQARLATPLFDTPRYARNLERAFDLMAQISAQAGGASAFSVLEGSA